MLHNFLNFLPFIILPFRGNERRRGRKKKLNIIVKGKLSLVQKTLFTRLENVFFLRTDVEVFLARKVISAQSSTSKLRGRRIDMYFDLYFRDFLHFPAWKSSPLGVCVKDAPHQNGEVVDIEKRKKMIETLTYGWSGWDIIYRTDAFWINFSPELQQTPVYMRQPTIEKKEKENRYIVKKGSGND